MPLIPLYILRIEKKNEYIESDWKWRIDMKNIVLIGMPGSGKSTVGVVLAKILGMGFIDSDLVIQEEEHRLLTEIIKEEGVNGFIAIENQVNQHINVKDRVIATGGSAIYGSEAMEHFRENDIVVYLQWSYEEIESRLGDLKERGVVLKPGQDLKALYEERCPLYEKYAHIIINCEGLSITELACAIEKRVSGFV